MKTYQMAGDAGDCIFAMPVVRALGGGILCLHAEKWTREPMTQAKVDSIRTLLIQQPYIKDVRWLSAGEKADVNLNDFRAEYFRTFKSPDFPKRRNLCEWILRTHGCDPLEQNVQWLSVVPVQHARVIVNRTGAGRGGKHVYRNALFPWAKVVEKYRDDGIAFVGTRDEHQEFCVQFGEVTYRHTTNLLELAQVIAGADLFIGNQSLPYAIAEGLKKRAVLEVCPWLPNCLFQRENVVHGWDGSVELPDLC